MKIRGFKLSDHHHHPTHRPKHSAYHRLHCHNNSPNHEPGSTELVGMTKSFSHARSFSRLVGALIQFFDNCGVSADGGGCDSRRPPKGHLAVYVRMEEEEWRSHRFYVPVVYVNHPLFVELLEEAEKEYGLHYRGGITIPCSKSAFENIRSRIAASRSERCRKPAMDKSASKAMSLIKV